MQGKSLETGEISIVVKNDSLFIGTGDVIGTQTVNATAGFARSGEQDEIPSVDFIGVSAFQIISLGRENWLGDGARFDGDQIRRQFCELDMIGWIVVLGVDDINPAIIQSSP